MRRRRAQGVTLTELMMTVVMSCIVALAGYSIWEMSASSSQRALERSANTQSAQAVMACIEPEIMRAAVIEIPDPDHTDADSIQLRVPTDDGTSRVRRAFRLENGHLIVDRKDEAASFVAFPDITLTELTFVMQDSPTNSQVEITCEAEAGHSTTHIQSIVTRRNQ